MQQAIWTEDGMKRVNQDALELLPVLEHLDYIIGCVAIDATGEAKRELRRLLDVLGEGQELVQKMPTEAAELVEAEECFKRNEYSQATGLLVRASHWLWDRVCPSNRNNAPAGANFVVREPGKPPRELTAEELHAWMRENRGSIKSVTVRTPEKKP